MLSGGPGRRRGLTVRDRSVALILGFLHPLLCLIGNAGGIPGIVDSLRQMAEDAVLVLFNFHFVRHLLPVFPVQVKRHRGDYDGQYHYLLHLLSPFRG